MDSHSVLQYMQSVFASDQVVSRFYHRQNWTNRNPPFPVKAAHYAEHALKIYS